MCFGPVVAHYTTAIDTAAKRGRTMTRSMSVVVTTTGMVVVILIYMGVIPMPLPRCISVVVRRVVTPIEGRVPGYPSRPPKPVIDDRTVDIDRLNHIVGTIDILVTNHLDRDGLVCLTLNIDACYVLIDIFCQHGLQYD